MQRVPEVVISACCIFGGLPKVMAQVYFLACMLLIKPWFGAYNFLYQRVKITIVIHKLKSVPNHNDYICNIAYEPLKIIILVEGGEVSGFGFIRTTINFPRN